MIVAFMDLIYFGVWRGDEGDGMNKFCWKLSSQDIFDVRSYYKGLVTLQFTYILSMEDCVETKCTNKG